MLTLLQRVTFDALGRASRLHISANASSQPFSARTSLILGSLRRAVHRTPRVALLEKSVFNLRIDTMEPLLGSPSPLLISGEFRFQLRDPIFGGPELI